MRGTNSKNKKNGKKTTFQGLSGGEMGLKSRDPQNTHVGYLFNVYTNFNFLAQFGRELEEEQPFFQVKNEGKPYTFPPT